MSKTSIVVSRRLALGAVASEPLFRFLSGPAHARGSGKDRIDVHHHFVPPEYLRRARDRVLGAVSPSVAPSIEQWSALKSLDQMNAANIDLAILSLSTPGVWWGDVELGRALARITNEYAARLKADYPGRFGGFAAVALPDIDGSLQEITYACDRLGLEGIGLMSSYEGKWLGDPVFAPVMDELNRRKAIVFVHPTSPTCCSSLMPEVPPALMEFLTDTTRTITSLLVNGAFSKYPDIRFIFPHTGGTITVLAARYDGPALGSRKTKIAPDGVRAVLEKLHFDVADSVNPATMSALLNTVQSTQILFGSDHPIIPIKRTADALDAYPLESTELRRINRTNAAAMLAL